MAALCAENKEQNTWEALSAQAKTSVTLQKTKKALCAQKTWNLADQG